MRRDRVKPRTVAMLMLVIFILSSWLYNMYDDNRSLEYDIELYKIALCNKDTVIMSLSKQMDSIKNFKPKAVYIQPEKKIKPKIQVDTTKVPKLDSVIVPTDTMRSE